MTKIRFGVENETIIFPKCGEIWYSKSHNSHYMVCSFSADDNLGEDRDREWIFIRLNGSKDESKLVFPIVCEAWTKERFVSNQHFFTKVADSFSIEF